MFTTLLTIHSLVRWFVLIGLLLTITTSWNGLRTQRPFSKNDNRLRIFTVTITHVQLVLGLWLYFISPMVDYFVHHFKSAVHERELRFFGMEHITMMVIAITLITIGGAKAKRKQKDADKFKTYSSGLRWHCLLFSFLFRGSFLRLQADLTSGCFEKAFYSATNGFLFGHSRLF